MKKKVGIVYENNSLSGGGHKSRCYTISKVINSRGHDVDFISINEFQYESFNSWDIALVDCIDYQQTREILNSLNNKTKIFTFEYFSKIRPFPYKNIAVCMHGRKTVYPTVESFDYAVVRNDLIEQKRKNRPPTSNQNLYILFTFGKSDSKDHLIHTFNSLKNYDSKGYKFIFIESKKGQLKNLDKDTNYFIDYDPINFCELLANAALVITSGGMTAIECNYLGKPSILFSQNEFEKYFHEQFIKNNGSLKIDENWISLLDDFIAGRLTVNIKSFIDGYGAERIADMLLRDK